VAESDLPAIKDKTDQHHADGFLLVTTTIPGTGLKEKLDSFDRSRAEISTHRFGTNLS